MSSRPPCPEVGPGRGEIADVVRDVGEPAALGLAEMDVVDGGEPAQKLTRRPLQCASLYAVAHERGPGLEARYDLVAGSGPVPALALVPVGSGEWRWKTTSSSATVVRSHTSARALIAALCPPTAEVGACRRGGHQRPENRQFVVPTAFRGPKL